MKIGSGLFCIKNSNILPLLFIKCCRFSAYSTFSIKIKNPSGSFSLPKILVRLTVYSGSPSLSISKNLLNGNVLLLSGDFKNRVTLSKRPKGRISAKFKPFKSSGFRLNNLQKSSLECLIIS